METIRTGYRISKQSKATLQLQLNTGRAWMSSKPTSSVSFLLDISGQLVDNSLGWYRYGVEVGRLHLARVEAEKGYDIARRGGVVKAVQDDIKVYLTFSPFFSRCDGGLYL